MNNSFVDVIDSFVNANLYAQERAKEAITSVAQEAIKGIEGLKARISLLESDNERMRFVLGKNGLPPCFARDDCEKEEWGKCKVTNECEAMSNLYFGGEHEAKEKT